MPRYNIIYESDERIRGHLPRSKEWIVYTGRLTIKDGDKNPVTLKMTFEPPHPFPFSMPEKHSIKAESVTGFYMKLNKFLMGYGIPA